MNRLKVELRNCYGIKLLDTIFEFGNSCSVYAIYAANGCMKTSFAQTFQDLANGVPSKDRVFTTRTTLRKVQDENGAPIAAANVLVVRPLDDQVVHAERTSLLLVNSRLRSEYEQLHADVDAARKDLLIALRAVSGIKKSLEEELADALGGPVNLLREALLGVQAEVRAVDAAPFESVPYSKVFDDKAMEALSNPDLRIALDAYIKQYTILLEKSEYFTKGVFNFHNGSTVAKSLASNGFFKANHTITLKAGQNRAVTTEGDLLKLIENEKERILNDTALKAKFNEIEKLLIANKNLRELQDLLSDHQDWVPELADVQSFKKKVWISYLHANRDLYLRLVDAYERADTGRRRIEEEARRESTLWEKVIEIFNDRFIVPFKLVVENREKVILGLEPITLGFRFEDGQDHQSMAREDLTRILSAGEKRALYILDILFEIEVRTSEQRTTFAIVDDIADSFDYKNKYAIIEYLKEMSETHSVRMILLTHNFDFFRTIQSRGIANYKCCLIATRSDNGIQLQPAVGIKNVFVNVWKAGFDRCGRMRIACIPFMRNLIEFTKGDGDADYRALTSLLHLKPDTLSITQRQLYDIYNRLFGCTYSSSDEAKLVVDLIRGEAQNCMSLPDGLNLENKVLLSIAIRLGAEEFMLARIADQTRAANISSNQTPELLKILTLENGASHASFRVLKRVVLMTPENIHLNSFMYEPIIDLSDAHLRRLYTEVMALN